MNKELVDLIAAIPAEGSSGNVGHKTAEAIVAAVEAAQAKPKAEKKIEPVHIKSKEAFVSSIARAYTPEKKR